VAADCSRDAVLTIAGDHPLVDRAEGHGGLPGQDPGACPDRRAEPPNGVDEFESRADGTLGVILVGDGCAPDGHDRVADELLDGAAVPSDDVPGQVEVARQKLSRFLGVAVGSVPRELDQVGKEHRDEAALGDRGWSAGSGRRGDGHLRGLPERRTAASAELFAGFGRRSAGGAGGRETGPALDAESSPGPVFRSAVGADHAGNTVGWLR
jgi:hypothetical protein